MKRTLSLKREALAELSEDDLVDVAGAAANQYSGTNGISCPIRACANFTLPPSCYTFPWC